ncbi:MAG TPA: FAD-binding protein [Syntrophorhabdaceae bacterium]|nr:FAD-binding protein [Syntrophorhabdaceae bacterium]HOL06239.1 FAD-binding protein [Syntrophorhabdaceae bacterium]HON84700.1 FAD-binding protein [Syntrophorhabdaceae bacterium]HOT41339.1 FAD-binding protein [Syntrophorhabdaceae bacterium]HPC66683.1 FAD-binding protein [Syntrophorhabdaceae bacterium]
MVKKKKIRPRVRLIAEKCIACGRCEPSCPANAIEYDTHDTQGSPIVNPAKCIGCKKCLKVCPAQAFELIYPIGSEKCNGCGECIQVCPTHAIEYDTFDVKGVPVITIDKCNGCKKCIEKCTSGALEDFINIIGKSNQENDDVTQTEKDSPTEKTVWKGVWVFVEHIDGKPNQVSWELLGIGSELASDLGTGLSAVIFGHNVEHLIMEAFGFGADQVYIIDHPTLRYYRTRPYLDCFVYLINKYHPEILLIGATGLGRDLASAVATALNTGLTADCTKLSIDKEKRLLEQTRPAFGGNVMATILTEHARPQMASVRPRVLPVPPFRKDRIGELIRESIELNEDEIATKILEIIPINNGDESDIRTAEIIVSGGKGMLERKNFSILEELASLLGGVVGASRCAVDAGWISHERQVGQTGKTVRPKLYLACGISGAIQHLVGMQNAEHIIAINKDKNAPIFEVAHVGIVGDVFEIVPPLITSLKEKTGTHSNL